MSKNIENTNLDNMPRINESEFDKLCAKLNANKKPACNHNFVVDECDVATIADPWDEEEDSESEE